MHGWPSVAITWASSIADTVNSRSRSLMHCFADYTFLLARLSSSCDRRELQFTQFLSVDLHSLWLLAALLFLLTISLCELLTDVTELPAGFR